MRTKFTALVLLGVAITAAAALGQEIALDFDPASTKVEFTLPDILHTVHGNFKLKSGALHFNTATGKISGQLVVDATSGDSGNERRDSRMHKAILESQRYPEIVFTPDRVEGAVAPQGASQVRVHGMFQIHGAAHEITLPVQVQVAKGQTTAVLRFTVPYVQWGMKNPSTLFLRCSDKVDIDITARARQPH